MTIDEAITTEIEYSQPCDIICKDGADCNDCRSYHRKLAECLEELKQYRTIGTVEECRKSVEICKFMIGRNITPENMEEYMKFEDECISEGFTFNSLLEAREK